ncbi:hypothetical protein CAPTEDRAFT_141614 [Capitella teleta]|uniref:SPRY domain-containing protein 7 n=1 Tax=Capitella teleta TaxID=283909 RepID=R7VKM6_CAPTE|nr:hypothetical protein CAPTEDRAFT_141614 [Capitella teleta]|eukprot:ELU17511.1 hypothetical protein CAPTEDRAFT_141614 [Capitella teleta]
MDSFMCCMRCKWGPGYNPVGHVRLEELPSVKLDTEFMGSDVVIVKTGKRICGQGACLANAPIAQDKAYFEAKLQSTGVWGIGLATKKIDVNIVPLGLDTESWVLQNDGSLMHNNTTVGNLSEAPIEGDVVGITYDHVELNFYINGKKTGMQFTGIKGTVYPVVYVEEGAILDMQFASFYHPAPEGFEEIMIEKSLL